MTEPEAQKPRTVAQLPWIKVRVGLPNDPAVLFLAGRLKLKPPHVVGLLVVLWGWADSVTEDGRLVGVTLHDIDSIVGCRAFGLSMTQIPEHPWLVVNDGWLELPRFDRHNGVNAKRRANDAERARRDRMDPNSPRSVRDASASDADRLRARGEERREEKDSTPAAPIGACPVAVSDVAKQQDPEVLRLADFHAKATRHWKPTANVNPRSAKSLTGFGKLLRRTSFDRVHDVLTWYFRGEEGDYEPRGEFDWRPNLLSGASVERAWDKIESGFQAAERRETEDTNGRH